MDDNQPTAGGGIRRAVERVDAYQKRHRPAGFALAVIKKFGEDRAGNLAALIAYYGFLSMFPLLLVFVTVLGFVLSGHPRLEERILHSALSQFPIIGDQIQKNVHSIRGSGAGLAVGLLATVWGGLGVTRAAQNAFNQVWDVPIDERPKFVAGLKRSLLLLVVGGLGVVATTVVSGIGARSGSLAIGLRVLAFAASGLLNVAVFATAFRILTVRPVRWGDVLPGAILAAVVWQVLQSVGGYYVGHQLKHASQTYGFFGVVMGLLSWIYLEAQVVLLAAEVNVVRLARLWPRSLAPPPLTPADRAAHQARVEASGTAPDQEQSDQAPSDQAPSDQAPSDQAQSDQAHRMQPARAES